MKYSRHILILLSILLLTVSSYANTCNFLFSRPTLSKNAYLQDVVQRAQKDRYYGLDWLEVLRTLIDDPTAFARAEEINFRDYKYSKKIRLDFHHPFVTLKTKSIKYKGRLFNKGSLKVPRFIPKDQQELLEFLVEFAHSLNYHQLNRNAFLTTSNRMHILNQSRSFIQSQKISFDNTREQIAVSNQHPLIKKLLELKTYFIQSSQHTAILLSTASPISYAREMDAIGTQYTQNIERLLSEVQLLLKTEVMKKKDPQERAYAYKFLDSIWHPFKQISQSQANHSLRSSLAVGWRTLLPIIPYKPFTSKNTHDSYSNHLLVAKKYLSDTITTTGTAMLLSLAVILPFQYAEGFPRVYESVKTFYELSKNKASDRFVEKLESYDNRTLQEISNDYLAELNLKISSKKEQQLLNPNDKQLQKEIEYLEYMVTEELRIQTERAKMGSSS